MINSLSSGKFLKNYPNHIVTRDYLTARIWDIRSPGRTPISSFGVCDYMEKNLLALYEEDFIYDKFYMDVSPCSNYIVTGGYNRSGHILDLSA